MTTVYLLRIIGTNDALYVGLTKISLQKSLDRHRVRGVASLRANENGKTVRAKAALMDKFRNGDVAIEIVGIRTTEDGNEAHAIERGLVGLLRPRFNTSLQTKRLSPLVIAPGERMLTYREAAKEFGYSYQTIRAHVCHGVIRAIDCRIPYSEMERYVADRLMSGRPRRVTRLHTKQPIAA